MRLDDDARELEQLMQYLQEEGSEALGIVGHSTGCQDAVYYLKQHHAQVQQHTSLSHSLTWLETEETRTSLTVPLSLVVCSLVMPFSSSTSTRLPYSCVMCGVVLLVCCRIASSSSHCRPQ